MAVEIKDLNFQEAVLNIIKQIPKGKLMTYGGVARELTGSVRAARAVGQAVAKNPYRINIKFLNLDRGKNTMV